MKRIATLFVFLFAFALPSIADGAPPVKAAFNYKVKWRAQAEFASLLFKNYYPVLNAQIADGKRNHGRRGLPADDPVRTA